MHYRTKFYYSPNGDPLTAVLFASGPVKTEAEADRMLELFLTTPGVTGGDVEYHINGIGWVPAETVK